MKSSHCLAHQVVNPLVLELFLVNYFINIYKGLSRPLLVLVTRFSIVMELFLLRLSQKGQ